MAHNHKEMSKPLALLLFIVTLPFVLVGLIVFGLIYVVTTVIPAPIEVLVYKRSQFYKDLKIKYALGITSNFGYKSYKYVKENPNLEMVFQDEGYYYYKTENAILVIPYYQGYYYENGKWMITPDEGKNTMEISCAKEIFAPLIKENIEDYELKLLVKEKRFSKESLELAKGDPVFVFYKNHKDFATIKA